MLHSKTWQRLAVDESLIDTAFRRNIHELNENELLIVPDLDKDTHLSKYNISENKWIKWYQCVKHLIKSMQNRCLASSFSLFNLKCLDKSKTEEVLIKFSCLFRVPTSIRYMMKFFNHF